MLYLIDYSILVKVEPSMQTDYSFKKTIFFLFTKKMTRKGTRNLKFTLHGLIILFIEENYVPMYFVSLRNNIQIMK